MSLEKRREPKRSKEKEVLQDSSFRRTDFRPLQVEEKEEEPPEVIVDELNEIEKDVLEIASDILKLKRYETEFEIESESQIQKYPIIEKLYAKCIAKLSYRKGYSKEEIFLAIRSLEEKSYIVTNERRTKLEILTNEKLVSILNFIKENPGIHARDEKIESELEITRTPFLKHVMTLERFKLVRSKRIGKSLHYFLSDLAEDYDKYKVIFLNPLIPQILEELFRDEAISISEIGNTLDMYSGTILYHVKKLKELDIIKSAKNQSNKKIHLVNVELLKKYNDFFKEPDFGKLLKGL
ncbi:MAG: winged helix-turn-helix transcriptional regulator [Promethearchaeota archaeon]